jgi:hypothetical protein
MKYQVDTRKQSMEKLYIVWDYIESDNKTLETKLQSNSRKQSELGRNDLLFGREHKILMTEELELTRKKRFNEHQKFNFEESARLNLPYSVIVDKDLFTKKQSINKYNILSNLIYGPVNEEDRYATKEELLMRDAAVDVFNSRRQYSILKN